MIKIKYKKIIWKEENINNHNEEFKYANIGN